VSPADGTDPEDPDSTAPGDAPGGVGDATDGVPSVEYVAGTGVPVRGNDVDTDQIIPARFLKAVTFDGLGQFAFFDQRFTDDDEQKDHPFNEERFQDASVLVVNANFGCGSSREHAPQALKRWGIDAVVGESFAEIFAGNCLALGVPTVTASPDDIEALQDHVDANPDAEIEVDVAAETVRYGAPETEPVEIVARYHGSSENSAQPGAHLVQSRSELKELGFNLPSDVDLEKQAMIVQTLGKQPTGGYWVRIDGVQKVGDTLHVQSTVNRPAEGQVATQQVTYPYAAVAIPATEATRLRTAPEAVTGQQPPSES